MSYYELKGKTLRTLKNTIKENKGKQISISKLYLEMFAPVGMSKATLMKELRIYEHAELIVMDEKDEDKFNILK